MALQWAICDVLGNGHPPGRLEVPSDENGPYRPVVDGLGPYRCLIIPGTPWAFVLIDADPAVLAATGRCEVLPADRLDTVLTPQRANQVNNALGRRGLPQFASAGMTYRDVIVAIARELDPTFDVGWWPGAS